MDLKEDYKHKYNEDSQKWESAYILTSEANESW